MDFFKKVAFTLATTFFSIVVVAQTSEQVNEIISSYDTDYLIQLADKHLEKSLLEKEEAVTYANFKGIPVKITLEDGGFAELQKVKPDGTLIYYRTYNIDAAKSTRTNFLNSSGGLGLNLDGQNMTAYVWDGGHPRITHQEYHGAGGLNRVTVEDAITEGGTQLHFHAAHVVGTIASSGVVAQAKGMAPHSKTKAYMWNSDFAEATAATLGGMLISNHSYGYDPNFVTDDVFGNYDSTSRAWDDLHYNAPYYLMVVAAGNEGTNNVNSTPLDPLFPQYDKLTGHSTSKNNLVVASAQDANIDSNGNLVTVNISSFSNQGPTDDYRIKPDITGNGHGVYSTFESSDTDYNTISGTSMASPNVAGTLLLLQQYVYNETGAYMRAATLKGLALHTADDAGMTGPDAIFGWGLLNAKKATETITNKNISSIIEELTLLPGQTYTIQVESNNINDLMASISWTDPAGSLLSGTNDPTPRLVNDLDIRVTQGVNTYYPWRLTGVNTNSNSGDNYRDPYERVDVANASGTYTITVTHKGSLTGLSQNYSLIITGVNVECIVATVPDNITVSNISGTQSFVSWTTVPGAIYDLRFRESGTSAWTLIQGITQSNYTLTGLTPLTAYDVQVMSACPGGTSSIFSTTVNFTTTGLEYCTSNSQLADVDFHISNVQLNSINNTSTESAYTDFTHLNTVLEQGETYTISITTTADAPNYYTYYSVWIDYDLNEKFDGEGELVFTIATTSGAVATGTFTVPVGIDPVTTRMRVSMSNSGLPSSCEVFDFGEVEDYTVIIGNVPACAAVFIPQHLSLQGVITSASAKIGWQPVPDAMYDMRYRETGNTTWIEENDIHFVQKQISFLTPETTYEVQVKSKCPDSIVFSDYSPSLYFSTASIYCDSRGNSVDDEYISRVQFADIDHASQDENGGYSNFTSVSTVVNIGDAYNLTVTPQWTGTVYPEGYAVWIDYNQNGSFDDPGELVWSQAPTTATTVGGSITIPVTAIEGQTRMRVALKYNAIPTSCEIFQWGEVEDYTIILKNPAVDYIFENTIWTPANPSGVATANDNILVINGEATLTANTEINDITVYPNATLNLENTLKLNGSITANGDLVFVSGASTTAQLDVVPARSGIAGEVTVQRHIPARRAFRFLTSAVNTTGSIHTNWQEGAVNASEDPNPGFGTHITGSASGANGFDATPSGNPSMFTLNNSTQTWEAVNNTNVNALDAGVPYRILVRGGRDISLSDNNALPSNTVLRSKGRMPTGTHIFNDLGTVAGDFNFFGNPYQAIVNMTNVIAASTNINNAYYYIWDPLLGQRGAYVTIDLGDGSNAAGSQANQYLQPGQAAFVTTLNNGPSSVVFEESHKSVAQPLTAVFSAEAKMDIRLYEAGAFAANNPPADALRLKFSENGNNEITPLDAPKFYNQDENLASVNGEKLYSIEDRALPIAEENIVLFTNKYRSSNYVVEVNLANLDNVTAYLRDAFTGIETELDNNNTTLYPFNVDANDAYSLNNNRFEIFFTEKIMAINPPAFGNDFILFPNPVKNGIFYIATSGLEGQNVSIKVHNMLGQEVFTTTKDVSSGGRVEVNLPSLSSGVYNVILTDVRGNSFTAKLVN